MACQIVFQCVIESTVRPQISFYSFGHLLSCNVLHIRPSIPPRNAEILRMRATGIINLANVKLLLLPVSRLLYCKR
jgi:hypothetical protein